MQNPKQKFVLDYLAAVPQSATSASRRLRADYFGPLLNVRRSSDNATRDLYSDLAGNLNVADLLSCRYYQAQNEAAKQRFIAGGIASWHEHQERKVRLY